MNSEELFDAWMKLSPKMTNEVLTQDRCDIARDFMGFVEIYYALSKIIPTHWTIVDIGCAFAAQCLYFQDHKKYIGICPEPIKRFSLCNCRFDQENILNWIEKERYQELNLDRTFAIMSYVPADEYSYFFVKNVFKNLFVYYPSQDPISLK